MPVTGYYSIITQFVCCYGDNDGVIAKFCLLTGGAKVSYRILCWREGGGGVTHACFEA